MNTMKLKNFKQSFLGCKMNTMKLKNFKQSFLGCKNE
jgi:hypothetical protein